MTVPPTRRRCQRGLFLVLAALALALQILVPQGFMIDGKADQAGLLVICTGHGPITSALDLGQSKSPAPKGKTAAPCPFAAHGGTPTLDRPVSAFPVSWSPTPSIAPTPADQVSVGRGLAAPPPARGPPVALI